MSSTVQAAAPGRATQLSVTPTEFLALQEMTAACTNMVNLIPVNGTQVLSPTPTPDTVILHGKTIYDPFGADRDCGDFQRWSDAQAFYEAAGGPERDPHRLDGNKDQIACNSLPGAP